MTTVIRVCEIDYMVLIFKAEIFYFQSVCVTKAKKYAK
jgi:hypothetical protein